MFKQILIISVLVSVTIADNYGGRKTISGYGAALASRPSYAVAGPSLVAARPALAIAARPAFAVAARPAFAAAAPAFVAAAPALAAAPAFAAAAGPILAAPAPAFTAAAAAPAFFANAAPVASYGTSGPAIVSAAIQSRHNIQYYDVPTSRQITPISIDIGANVIPVSMVFRSASSQLSVEQNHLNQGGSVQETASQDEPHVLRHTVHKPILQEVREVIVPMRRIQQEIQPVQEEVQTLIARGRQQATQVATVVAAPVATVAAAPVAAAPVATVAAAPVATVAAAPVTTVAAAPVATVAAAPAAATIAAGPALATGPAFLIAGPAFTTGQTFATGPALAAAAAPTLVAAGPAQFTGFLAPNSGFATLGHHQKFLAAPGLTGNIKFKK
uniref:Calphotin-like isoform X2 n=1 Tax=Dermatophagoides pteronyssinus TaxID=6956 RepID=A0A6P6YBC5_DERPT|nr:calphotin-like isoform X2 [Dermatophagoides pteronyssinus]